MHARATPLVLDRIDTGLPAQGAAVAPDLPIRLLAIASSCLLLFPYQLLYMFGWRFLDETGPAYQKLHPATYLLFVASGCAVLAGGRRYRSVLMDRGTAPFASAVAGLILWSIAIASNSRASSGALGIALTSFLSPITLLVILQGLRPGDFAKLAIGLRLMLLTNSLVSICEYLTRHSLLVTQPAIGWRSGGLLGHPLTCAALTGMMLLHLLTAEPAGRSQARATPEIVIHALAMFAFGSRTALIVVPALVLLHALRPGIGQPVRPVQRLIILSAVLLALGSTLLPVDMIQSAMDRFAHDNGSAGTRHAALGMLASLDTDSLLWGVDSRYLVFLRQMFGTDIAVELAWVSLSFTFGLVATLAIGVTLLLMVAGQARMLDRSAALMAIYFFVFTAGSVSFGTKSLLICQLLLFMRSLGQRRPDAAAQGVLLLERPQMLIETMDGRIMPMLMPPQRLLS